MDKQHKENQEALGRPGYGTSILTCFHLHPKSAPTQKVQGQIFFLTSRLKLIPKPGAGLMPEKIYRLLGSTVFF